MRGSKESIFAHDNIPNEPLKQISEGEDEFMFHKYAKLILPEYRAEIWNYFGHPADSNGNILTCRIAICIFCHIKLRPRNSSSMRQHLLKHHPKEYSTDISLDSDFMKDLKVPVEKLSHKDMRSYRDKTMYMLKVDKILTLEDIRRHPIYRFFGYPANSDGSILSYEIIFCTVCKKGLVNNTCPKTVKQHLQSMHPDKYKIVLNLMDTKSEEVKPKRAERIDKIAKELNDVPSNSLKSLPVGAFNDNNLDLEFDYVMVSDVARSIWQYFGYPADKNKEIITDKIVICIFCKAQYQKHSVASIKKHFKSVHFKLLNKPMDELILLAKTPVITVNAKTLRNYRTVKLQSINYAQILTLEKHKTHHIYKYFGFPADADGNIITTDMIFCNICKRIFFSSNKTSNLLKHVRSFHADVYEKIELKTFKTKVNDCSIEENNFSATDENNSSIEENNFSIEENEISALEFSSKINKILKPKLIKPDKNSIWNWFGFPADNQSKIITKNVVLCTICFKTVPFTKKSRNSDAFKHLEEMHDFKCEKKFQEMDALKFNNIQMNHQQKFFKILKPKNTQLIPNSFWNWFGFPGTEDSLIARKDIIICSICYTVFDYKIGCKPSKAITHLENFHKITENAKNYNSDIEIKECDSSKFSNFATKEHKPKNMFMEINEFIATTIKSVNKIDRKFFVNDSEFLLTKNIRKIEKLLKTSLNVNFSLYKDIIYKLTNNLKYSLSYEIWNNVNKVQHVSIYLNFIDKANLKWYPLSTLKLENNNFNKIFQSLNLNNCSAVITNSSNEKIDSILVQKKIPVVECFRSVIENCLTKIFELPKLSRAIKEISRCNKINILNYTSNWSIFDLLKNFRNLNINSRMSDFTVEISSIVEMLTPLKNAIENLNNKSEILSSDATLISDSLLKNYMIDDFHDTVLNKSIKEIVNEQIFKKFFKSDFILIASVLNPKAVRLLDERNVQDIMHKKLGKKSYLKTDFSNYLAQSESTSDYTTLEWWYHNKHEYSNEFVQLAESFNCTPLVCNSYLATNYENQFHIKRQNLKERLDEILFLHYLNLYKNDFENVPTSNNDIDNSVKLSKCKTEKGPSDYTTDFSNDRNKDSSLKRKRNNLELCYFDGSESDFSNDLDNDFEIENENYDSTDFDSDRDGNIVKKQNPIFKETKNKATSNRITKSKAPISCKRLKLDIYGSEEKGPTKFPRIETVKEIQKIDESEEKGATKFPRIETVKEIQKIDESEEKVTAKFPKLETVKEIQKLENDLKENPALKAEYIEHIKLEWVKTRNSTLGCDILANIISEKLVFILHSLEFEQYQSHNITFYKFIENFSNLYECLYVSSNWNDEKDFDTYMRKSLIKAKRRYVQRRNKVEKTYIERKMKNKKY